MVIRSRVLKVLFSGNLDAKIVTHPYFEGTEKDLLRATIARITSGCVLNVKGFLKRDEDDPTVIAEDPEFKFPSADVLSSSAGWCHCINYNCSNH